MDVALQTAPNRIEFMVRGERFASYDYGGRAPGFTGLFAPGGRPLTSPESLSGLALWIGHPSVDGVAFGEPECPSFEPNPEEKQGVGQRITTEMMARRGSQSVGFQQECVWTAPDGRRLLRETCTVRVTSGPSDGGILDLTLQLSAPEDRPVLLGLTEVALLRMRVVPALFPAGGGQLRNSAGGDGVEAIQGQSAAWCGCTGVVQGETVGMVLMDHPGNLRHPPLWAASNEGVLGLSPLWGREREITPAQPLLLRFRLHTHRGYVEAGWAQERLAEFARNKYGR
jgi:hypothetical protein